jgi:hypothetical protein
MLVLLVLRGLSGGPSCLELDLERGFGEADSVLALLRGSCEERLRAPGEDLERKRPRASVVSLGRGASCRADPLSCTVSSSLEEESDIFFCPSLKKGSVFAD